MVARRLYSAVLFAAVAVVGPTGPAAPQDGGFQSYLQQVGARAQGQGVSAATVQSMLGDLTPNDRVMALDRENVSSGGTAGFPPLEPYLRDHNTPSQVARGRATYARLRPLAAQIEARYGVPEPIVIAIWGHETSYGANRGSFDLSRSLATLAWEGRRRALFEGELIDLLKIADTGIPRSTLVGSWAGAFGNPQFLPSVYLRLAVDGDGDGIRNIWTSETDTLHSIANYFRDAGWRAGQPWAVRAYAPNTVDRGSIRARTAPPVCPRVHSRFSRWMTVGEWRARGVIPQAPIADDVMTALFEPDGPAGFSYLLTQNYRVILEYNCSNYYAMSVGLLADEIAR
ncbi:MAG: lytic murein transglycosylase [Croceibacterium sp.]